MSSKIVDAIDPVSRRFLQAIEVARESGVLRRDLLHAIGISDSALSKLRAGKTRRPQDATLEGLRRVRIDPLWVRTGQGEMWLAPGDSSAPASSGRLDAAPADDLLRRALTEAYSEIDRLRMELAAKRRDTA